MPRKAKFNYDEVRKRLLNLGFTLLSEEYSGSLDQLIIQCPNGHITNKRLRNIENGKMCYECWMQTIKPRYEDVVKYFNSKKCILLEKEYINSTVNMKYVAECGHIWENTYADFLQRARFKCKNCLNLAKISQEKVEKDFAECGFEVLSMYKNSHTPVNVKCNNGHITQKSYGHRNQRCKVCWDEYNKGENCLNYNPDREEIAIRDKIRKRYYRLLRRLIDVGYKKKDKTNKILGYSSNELRSHLESFEEWPCLVDKKWHIDHIFPTKAFFDYGIKDPILINCLENLRPLEGKVNLQKNCKYNYLEFEKWLDSKMVEHSRPFFLGNNQ